MANEKLKNLHIVVLFVLATAGVLFAVVEDVSALWRNLLLSLLWLSVFTAGNLAVYRSDRYRKFSPAAFAAMLALIFWLGLGHAALPVLALLCVTIADCYVFFNGLQGTALAVASFAVYVILYALNSRLDARSVLIFGANQSLVFLLTAVISYLIGKILRSNAAMERTVAAAQARQIDLNNAYVELDRAYRNLEEMSALKERNRIAREIHDTVGHTLTTVIVEMEAGRLLMEKDPGRAGEKFVMAHAQARKALEELRASVRLLASAARKTDLKAEAMEIANDTAEHAGVNVKCDISLPAEVESGAAAIALRALKEGLANGIRHGGSTAFFLKLHAEGERLEFLLQDNGRGTGTIAPGFGLSNMRKGVEAAGGTAEFSSEPGEGFEIRISLPIREGEEHGADPRDAGGRPGVAAGRPEGDTGDR